VRIGIVAGEASGDYLGAGLIAAIQRRRPDASFFGICGPRMQALGAQSLFPMDSISIMGVDGLLKSVFKILRIRKQLVDHFGDTHPDVFIGVDVPDFNLRLEQQLRARTIKTIHYVSPTVWAWRGYRIHRIRKSVSHMLTLFPFEAEYYRRQSVPVTYVGHPVADEIGPEVDAAELRRKLELSGDPIVALLPGSRTSEVARLTGVFLGAAREIHQRYPGVEFIVPFANPQTRECFERLGGAPLYDLPVMIRDGGSRNALGASDVALVASGTAALEAALLGIPMVVAYKVSWLTGALVRMFAHVKYFSMPNNLLEQPVVPELLQDDATAANLARAALKYLDEPQCYAEVHNKLAGIHDMLRQNASERAAEVVIDIVDAHPS